MFRCYGCNHNAGEIIVKGKDMRFGCFGKDKNVIRCLRCDLTQLFPQWTDEELDKMYETYSNKKDFDGQKRKVKVSKYLKKHFKETDRILEVGCGYGDNLEYFRCKGYDVWGVDKSISTDNPYTFKMDVLDFESQAKFDVIYAVHLFEHLKDPAQFIYWMRENLNDGGGFILEVPCIDDPLLKLYKVKAFEKFYWYPYHLFFYSYEFLKPIKPIRRQEYGLINHLRWLILKRPGNWNPHIPIFDDIYKWVLKLMGYSDTLIIVGGKDV